MKIFYPVITPVKTGVITVLFILSTALSQAEAMPAWPWWPFKQNRFDKEGNYHGRWKIYLGEGKNKVLIRNGKFKHGKEVGKWYYYYPNGQLYTYEEHKRYENVFTVKRYHENGQLKLEGQAITINNGKQARYSWFGDWKVYDEQGNYMYTEVYDNGNLIAKR